LYDFDELIVAPGNGYNGADDYYARCSVAPLLDRITTPTLLVHARTDPWVPAEHYLDRAWRTDGPLTCALAPDGGHVGFHAADNDIPWHDRAIGTFFDRAAGFEVVVHARTEAARTFFIGGARRHGAAENAKAAE
jgi:predicted alpha/beta-fold hydrolase